MTGGKIARSGEKKLSTYYSLRVWWLPGWCCRDVPLHTTFNKGYHYILTVIEVLSKHAWTIPLKTKNGNKMATTIAKIIPGDGRCPKNLQTDIEKEFYNANVQKLLKNNINYYSIYSIMKVSVVERFNYTLKNDMWKQFTHNGNEKNESTCYRVSCLSTMRKTIELSVCGRCNYRLLTTLTKCTSMKWRFEKQMAHQCSVKRFNITRHFIVPSTSVKVIWLKSVCIVLCCCV